MLDIILILSPYGTKDADDKKECARVRRKDARLICAQRGKRERAARAAMLLMRCAQRGERFFSFISAFIFLFMLIFPMIIAHFAAHYATLCHYFAIISLLACLR